MSDRTGTFELQIVSPNRVVLKERVHSVIVPAVGGAVGFWADHAPMLTALAPGVVRYRSAAGHEAGPGLKRLAVGGGLFEVSEDGRATLLADTAELPEEIDVERARAALERARRRLLGLDPQVDQARAEIALQRAMARLRAASGVS